MDALGSTDVMEELSPRGPWPRTRCSSFVPPHGCRKPNTTAPVWVLDQFIWLY